MNSEIFNDANKLPKIEGIFNLLDKNGQCLFTGVSENVQLEVKKTFSKNEFLKAQTARIKTINGSGKDLINLYAQTIRRKNPTYNFVPKEQNLYPHLKITNEKFPRLLATRRVEDDEAEYFGAFLNETGVRILLGFSIDAFGLRGCDIPIDGSFQVPCPQFYRKKCVAPCVENLCDQEKYLEMVNLARLFLQNKREKLKEIILGKIQFASNKLDFERGARWRDFLQKIFDFWNDKERRYWLEDASDTFEVKISKTSILIFLATQRKRKTLGRHIFVYENKINFSASAALAQTLWQFYPFHAPKEIFVPLDFPSRVLLEKTLSIRAERQVKIAILKKAKQKITTNRALRRAEFEYEIENLKPQISLEEVQNEFKKEFSLEKKPQRIEAFDVAHISGTDFVGAKSVWEAGKFLAEEYEFWFLDEKNEPEAMAKTIENRFTNTKKPPDLILIDGGKSQLKEALKVIEKKYNLNLSVISAVKPPQKHNEISHFLVKNNQSIKYRKDSAAFSILLRLRDEAHNLANYIHRTKRETAHFYQTFQLLPLLSEKERYFLLRKFGSVSRLRRISENDLIECMGTEKGKAIFYELQNRLETSEPFIVPIRYDEPNGEATDLQPLFLRDKNFGKIGGGDRNRTDE